MKSGSLFAELRRRNAWRAGALCAAEAWVLAQGAARLLPVLGTPEWMTRWLAITPSIGFPFWLACAWLHELTPSGLKRGSEVAAGDSIARARKALVLQPDFPGPHAGLSQVVVLRGDQEAALRYATQEHDAAASALAPAVARQLDPGLAQADAAVQDYLTENGKDHPYYVAVVYPLRKQPRLLFDWLLRARRQRDPGFTGLLSDPFALAWQHDPRFAALRREAGLPLPEQAPTVTA